MAKKRVSFTIFLLLISLWNLPLIKARLEERLPDTFHIDKLAMDVKGSFPSWDLTHLREVIQQPFYYIGHGGQAVAFTSADGQYVVKFLLIKSMHGKKKFSIPKPTHWIPSHRKKRAQQREEKALKSLKKAMDNYSLAVSRMQEKTGILCLHLQATEEDLPPLHVFDNNGHDHIIDLNRASFIFQKKATLVTDQLNQAKSDEEKRKYLIALDHFFKERAQLGFIDIERDFMIEMNYGFVDGIPIQLDVGNIKYVKEQEIAPEKEIQRIRQLLQQWAQSKCLPPF